MDRKRRRALRQWELEMRPDLQLALSRKQSWHVDSKVQNEGVLQGKISAVKYVSQ